MGPVKDNLIIEDLVVKREVDPEKRHWVDIVRIKEDNVT